MKCSNCDREVERYRGSHVFVCSTCHLDYVKRFTPQHYDAERDRALRLGYSGPHAPELFPR